MVGYLRVYAHIIGLLHRGLEVEVFKVKSDKAHIATRQNTVNDELYNVEGTCWCTYISRVAYLTTSDVDACLIGILLMRFDLAYNHGVTNLFYSVLRDILKTDDVEGVRAFHSLVLGAF